MQDTAHTSVLHLRNLYHSPNRVGIKSAFAGQEKLAIWKVLAIAFVFFGMAELLSVTVAPLEARLFGGIREAVLGKLPSGFDWTDMEYLKSYSKPMLVVTCVYYSVFNVFVGPITEELYFRGYLTSHYEKQGRMPPILIAVLFSIYHFWLPFNNVFRILLFVPVAYVTYRKRNLYISICFHCLCNLFSVVSFISTVLA